jgi:hypothetical protein
MRNNPDTSTKAYYSIKNEARENHQSKIIEALKFLGSATYEEISSFLKWDDKNRAARRLAELERLQIVFKPGEKKKTKSGRDAYVYKLMKATNNYLQPQLF